MSDMDEKIIEKTKDQAKWGCFIWAAILLVGPLIWLGGSFFYEMYFQERLLVSSESPNKLHTIEVVEKGSPFFFGPSKVQIEYGWKQTERTIHNDGKMLNGDNVIVRWKNSGEAYVTLEGEEQSPEVVKIEFPNSQDVEMEAAQEEGLLLGSFDFKKSESPNKDLMIEFREVTVLKEPSPQTYVRVYYGKSGSILEQYIEYFPTDMYTPEHFKVEWQSNTQATIEVVRENEVGETFVEDTLEIDLRY